MKNINLSETSVPFHLQQFKGLPTSFTIDSTLIQVIAFHHVFHFYSVCFALWIFFLYNFRKRLPFSYCKQRGKREQIVIEFADLSVNEICEHLSRPSIWSRRNFPKAQIKFLERDIFRFDHSIRAISPVQRTRMELDNH